MSQWSFCVSSSNRSSFSGSFVASYEKRIVWMSTRYLIGLKSTIYSYRYDFDSRVLEASLILKHKQILFRNKIASAVVFLFNKGWGVWMLSRKKLLLFSINPLTPCRPLFRQCFLRYWQTYDKTEYWVPQFCRTGEDVVRHMARLKAWQGKGDRCLDTVECLSKYYWDMWDGACCRVMWVKSRFAEVLRCKCIHTALSATNIHLMVVIF